VTDNVLFEPLESRMLFSASLPIQPMPADPSAVPVDQQIAAGLNGMIPGGAFLPAPGSVIMGDFNGDGRLDQYDLDPFLEALADPEGWAAEFGVNPWARGDFNTDGVFDDADAALFDAALIQARIDNADGALTNLFNDAPLLSSATLYADGDAIMTGHITAVTLGQTLTLDLEA